MSEHDYELDPAPNEIYSSTTSESSSSIPPVIDVRNMDMEPIKVEDEVGDFNVKASQEGTRARIALNFTNIFLLLVALSILAPFIVYLFLPQNFSQPLESAKELVTILASVLAGPFGFIVGFYFKQNTDD